MLTETAPRAAPDATGSALTCRLCGSGHLRSFLDLGATPPCELFLPAEAVEQPEMTYPLHVRVCESCLLAQLPPLITPEETFTEYAYFSSFSTSWVEHARRFVDDAVARLGLGPESFVVEVASNDGYLLQHVVERGRGRAGEGGAHPHRVPRPGDRLRGGDRARPRRPGVPQQRLRPCARPG